MYTRREVALEDLALADLVLSCTGELQKYRRKQATDGCYCLELLRRATLLCLDDAWTVLLQLLNESVHIWLRAHPSYSLAMSYDSEENYTALTFTRFWSALREQRLHFTNLPTVLSYLHATLNSTIIDTLRMYMRVKCISLLDPTLAESAEIAIEENYHEDWTWGTIQHFLENEHERRLMYLLYYCGFKPREVVARFPTQFCDIKEVYRLNHNIIERLRRQRDRLRWLLGNQELEERTRRGPAVTLG